MPNPQTQSMARLIVCEKTERWALAWRGLTGESVAFWQTRSLAEVGERLREAPASVVALECPLDRVGEVCRWLERRVADFPQMRTVVLADPPLRPAECVLRTAGAQQVVYSPQALPAVTRWVVRHLDQVPRVVVPIRSWAWQKMPWTRRPGAAGVGDRTKRRGGQS
jgi:hypothetical protein